jgi:hypothetical protein
MKSVRCFITHYQSLPNFCHHQKVVSQSAAKNDRAEVHLNAAFYQYGVNLIVRKARLVVISVYMLLNGESISV